MPMTHRERAIAALNHQEPDRIPLDIGATRNTGILIQPYEALAEYTGIEDGLSERPDYGSSKFLGLATPSDEMLESLGIDFRGIYLGKPERSMDKLLPDGSHRDELGVIRRQPTGSPYWEVTLSPFDGDISRADINSWDWPDPMDPGYTSGLREKALNLRENTDCALVLHLQDIITHPTQYMFGFEKWYRSFILEPDLLSALMDAILELRMVVTQQALSEVGDLIDVVSCSDDVADKRGPMVSHDMYCEFIKPRHDRYLKMIKKHTSAKILYHSCGAVAQMIPDFIDMGVDFINPVQVSAADMDTARLKKEYGKHIGFWGAVDTIQVLPFGTPEEVKDEVKRRIKDLAPDGGFVLAAVHNIQPDVPPENIVAMFDAAREFGTYPIGI